jgi:F-type H+-transporting ATPase subunit epsilon
VDTVQLPGSEGEMGVLPGHEALVTELSAGEVRITVKGNTEVLAIGEGFAEITATTVGILTDAAVNEKDIDEKAAEEAVKRAEELLKSNTLQGEELEATQASLARSLAQMHVRRRRRS